MSRSVRIVLACVLTTSLLVGVAEDASGVSGPRPGPIISQQDALDDMESGVESDIEGEPASKPNNQAIAILPVVPNDQEAPAKPRTKLTNRLLMTGTLVVVLLGQLSVLFGYLKINHATRGFYSGRLQSFSVVASVAVFATGYLFFIAWKI